MLTELNASSVSRHVRFDNILRRLRSSQLCARLTQTRWFLCAAACQQFYLFVTIAAPLAADNHVNALLSYFKTLPSARHSNCDVVLTRFVLTMMI